MNPTTQPKVTTYKTALILSEIRNILGNLANTCEYMSHGSASIEPLDSSGVFGVMSYAAYVAYEELAAYEEDFIKACGFELPLTGKGYSANEERDMVIGHPNVHEKVHMRCKNDSN